MRKLLCIVFAFILLLPVFAEIQNTSVALKYLDFAQNMLYKSDWNNAYKQAEKGLLYNLQIADLYYVQALAYKAQNNRPCDIQKLLEEALKSDKTWYKYNRDAAKLLQAQLNLDTGKYEEALILLNEYPEINTYSATCLRAEIYYCLGQLENAREIINTALKLYPYKDEIQEIFLKKELSNFPFSESTSISFLGKNILNTILKSVYTYSDKNPNIPLYASFYAEGDEQKRFLQTYAVHGITNPFYAVCALKSRILEEEECISLFFELSKEQITFTDLVYLVNLLKEEESILFLQSILDTYTGTMILTEEKNHNYEYFINYINGRPSYFEYDKHCDGDKEFLIDFDFGNPSYIKTQNSVVIYGDYPFVQQINLDNGKQYFCVTDSFIYSPIEVKKTFIGKGSNSIFLPVILENNHFEILDSMISIYAINSPICERENAEVRVSFRDGIPIDAIFMENGIKYADAYFENGILVSRNLDTNNNGFYDVTEKYSKVSTQNEKWKTIEKNIFGLIQEQQPVFLSGILSDIDENSIIDYVCEILEDGSYTEKRDYYEQEKWSVIYQSDKDKSNIEVSFLHPLSQKKVTVLMDKEEPVLITIDGISKKITFLKTNNIYWIGEVNTKILNALNEKSEENFLSSDVNNKSHVTYQIINCLFEDSIKSRIILIKVNSKLFGEIIYE